VLAAAAIEKRTI